MLRTKPTTVVIFDGQSLVYEPPSNPFPDIIMRRIHTDRHWRKVPVGGASWADLLAGTGAAAGQPASTRLYPQVNGASKAILVLQGGQGSIFQGRTGLQTYQDYRDYANAARSAGFTHIIATTMPAVADDWVFFGWNQTHWAAANAATISDSDNAFDDIVDLDVGILSDPDSGAFVDGLHFNETGSFFCADILQPYVEAAEAA